MDLYSRLLMRFFRINLNDADDRNAYYLVAEVFWAAILSSAASFNAAFALRLGAQNVDVGLLTSIPALMAVLISIPSGRFLERRARRTPWVLGSLFIYRVGFLIAAASPWVHIPGVPAGTLVVLVLVILTAPAYFFNVGWIPLLADVIPEERRAAVFAGRNIMNGVTVSIFGFLFGQWLNRAAFPMNYQVMYLVGFIASMVSMANLLLLKVPDSMVAQPKVRKPREKFSLAAMLRDWKDDFTRRPQFLAITRNTLFHGIGVWLASPLYVLYYVRELKASDAWLGANGMVTSIGTIIGFSAWRWIMARWGEQVTLKRTIVLIGLYPVLVGLMVGLPFLPVLTIILGLSVLNGLVSPGVSLSHFNTLLKTMPEDARPSYTAVYTTIMNIGAFICPLIGVAIADVIGLRPMLVIAGLLSVIGSTSFWWWPVMAHSRPAQVAELKAD